MDGNLLVAAGGLMFTIIGCTWALGSRLSRIEVAIEHLKGEVRGKASDSDVQRAIRNHMREEHGRRSFQTPPKGVSHART